MKKQLEHNAKSPSQQDDFFRTFRNSVTLQKGQIYDWRTIVRNCWQLDHHLIDTWTQSFAKVLEKHVALQAISILNGSYNYLLRWPIKPWDDPNSVEYALKPHARWPKNYRSTISNQPLVGVVKILDKTLKRIFHDRFSIDSYTVTLNKSEKSAVKVLRAVDFDDDALHRTLFLKMKEHQSVKGYRFANCQGLGAKICFDPNHRTFYFDSEFFLNKPATHLFYPMNLMVLAEQNSCFAFLHLDPAKEILPVMKAVYHSIRAGMENALVEDLSATNRKQLLELGLDTVSIADLDQIASLLWDELYKEQLCQSLDLVGIVESYFSINVFDDSKPTVLKLVARNKRIQMLLEHCTHIQFHEN